MSLLPPYLLVLERLPLTEVPTMRLFFAAGGGGAPCCALRAASSLFPPDELLPSGAGLGASLSSTRQTLKCSWMASRFTTFVPRAAQRGKRCPEKYVVIVLQYKERSRVLYCVRFLNVRKEQDTDVT